MVCYFSALQITCSESPAIEGGAHKPPLTSFPLLSPLAGQQHAPPAARHQQVLHTAAQEEVLCQQRRLGGHADQPHTALAYLQPGGKGGRGLGKAVAGPGEGGGRNHDSVCVCVSRACLTSNSRACLTPNSVYTRESCASLKVLRHGPPVPFTRSPEIGQESIMECH